EVQAQLLDEVVDVDRLVRLDAALQGGAAIRQQVRRVDVEVPPPVVDVAVPALRLLRQTVGEDERLTANVGRCGPVLPPDSQSRQHEVVSFEYFSRPAPQCAARGNKRGRIAGVPTVGSGRGHGRGWPGRCGTAATTGGRACGRPRAATAPGRRCWSIPTS